MTTGWPTCFRCPDSMPARFHVRGGNTAAMDAVRLNTCDRHLSAAQKETRGFDYRETRPAAPSDAITQPEGEQGSLFEIGEAG